VLPAERRDVLEEVIGRDPVVPAQMRDGAAVDSGEIDVLSGEPRGKIKRSQSRSTIENTVLNSRRSKTETPCFQQ
jgi:hypothetical protein